MEKRKDNKKGITQKLKGLKRSWNDIIMWDWHIRLPHSFLSLFIQWFLTVEFSNKDGPGKNNTNLKHPSIRRKIF